MGGGGDLLTGQEEQTVCSLSLTNFGGILTGREDWVWQRTYIYLSTSSSPPLHFPITARCYRMLCFSPQDQPSIRTVSPK